MAEENTNDEIKLVEQNDGSAVVDGGTPPPPDAGAEDDAPLSSSADSDDHADEPGADGETQEEAEARRERNRARRQDSKQKRKDYVESLKREIEARDSVINDLSQRMATVERKSTGSEMAQLDGAIKQAAGAYEHFKKIHQQAVEAADGASATQAMENMMVARQRAEQLVNVKKAYSNRQQAPQPLDPRMTAHAQTWMDQNRWYDPNGKDPDSRIALTIDQTLADEGWNPTTPQYWQELDSRLKKYLPHRARVGYNGTQDFGQRGSARSPVAGSSRESAGSQKAGGYTLSSDRVQALKEAGLWDDPKARAEAVKRYQEFDRQSAA